MNKMTPLATFTPSLVEPEILEKLFVGREKLVSDLVERAKTAATSNSRAHRMIVGPRGAGKTHLVSIANHRIRSIDGVQVAWLSEDPWLIESYVDLLREILFALDIGSETSGDSQRRKEYSRLRRELEAEIQNRAERCGVIVVLAENFDQILESLEEQGQRQLRSFLENDRALLLCVTATKLGDSVIKQTAPFYECFSRVELQPFTIDEAIEMLARIADYRGSVELAERLRDPKSLWVRHRLQAVDALAGGQPRVWALLGGSLTVEGFSDLANLLLQRFDDLVPYYQQQLAQLSPRERKAVRKFADANSALNVKQLAAILGAEDKSIGKTIVELTRKGWIRKVDSPFLKCTDGRRTYYELAEPLARLAFQMKDNRGTALPMLVDFFSAWFSTTELGATGFGGQNHLISMSIDASISSGKRPHDLAKVFNGGGPSCTGEQMLELVDEALHNFSLDDAGDCFELPTGVRRIIEAQVESDGLFETRMQILSASPLLGSWFHRTDRFVRSTNEESERCQALLLHATVLYRTARCEEASMIYQQVLQTREHSLGPDHPDTLHVRQQLLDTNTKLLDSTSWEEEANALLSDITRVLGAGHRETLRTRFLLAQHLLDSRPRLALSKLTNIREDQESTLGIEHLDVFDTRHFEGIALQLIGKTSKAKLHLERLLAEMTQILGPQDPNTLAVRNSLAIVTGQAGHKETADEQLAALLTDMQKVLGPEHPNTLATQNNLERMRLDSDRAA